MAANPIVPFSLTLETKAAGDTVTVVCHGKIASDGVQILQQEVRKLIGKHKRIVLDLTGVSYMDSSGLGMLVGLYVSARKNNTELKLINLNQRIKELLRLTKLASVFDGYGEYL
jgi:anti-sigma B factor antagonist